MNLPVAVTLHGTCFDPARVWQEAFRLVDFSAYLSFMEVCKKITPTGTLHEHHILPQSLFPEFAEEPANKIMLRTEDHARAPTNDTDIPELYTPPAFVKVSSDMA